jgi:serine/threonine protein kinase
MDQALPLPQSAAVPSEIGGYEVIRALGEGQSWLAAAPGGRVVVLKMLDEDCLWKSQLHPSIKDRLGRVRELAHVGVANLYGVERADGLVYMVWEYVAGDTLDEYVAARCAYRDLVNLARDLVLSVEMLHARGIVHGNLKCANVIVTEDGKLVLTHISPLLYTEPENDVSALLAMLQELVEKRREENTPLARLIESAGNESYTLRQLAARLGGLLEERQDLGTVVRQEQAAKSIRKRTLVGAAICVIASAGIFAGLKLYANQHTPKPPVAPHAPPAALQPTPREPNVLRQEESRDHLARGARR